MEAHIVVDGRPGRTSSMDAIRAAHAAGRTMWVELGDRSAAAEEILASTFHIHPLVIEDIFGERSTPKIDAFDEYLYVVVHGLRQTDDPKSAEMGIVDVVIGRTFVLTQHREGPADARLRDRVEGAPELLAKGPAWVAHAFIDLMVDRFLPFMQKLGDEADALELEIVARGGGTEGRDLMPELFALKRSLQSLCRIAAHEREILRRLAREAFQEIPEDARPYFADVFDHFSRVADQADTYRDVVANAVDAYLSVQSNRMNATVKRLTLISTMMLPLTLITSFYGMNFKHMPELDWAWGRVYVVALMTLVAFGVWGWFKKKRWL